MAEKQPMFAATGFEPEIQDITRQRELSKLLLQQGLQGNLQGQMVSGRYVPSHPLEGIANIYSAYKGRQLAKEADTKQAQLAELIRKGTAEDMLKFNELRYGTPAQEEILATPENVPMGQTVVDDEGRPTLVQAQRKAMAANPSAAYKFALQSQFPQVSGQAYEMLKPQKFGPDETLQVFNPTSNKLEIIGQGISKLPADVHAASIVLGLDRKPREQWTQQDLMAIDNQIQKTKKSGASNITLSTEKSYGSAFGQGLAKSDLDLYEQAVKAPESLQTVQSTKKLLNSGKVYTGFGANAKLDLARVGDALGVVGKDTQEKITNTQQLFANRAQATLDSVKASGLGAGNGFTNADREFLEKAKLGGITYDRTALQRQLDIEEKVARASANKWNTRLKAIPKSATEPTGIKEVTLPMEGAIDTSGGSGRGWRIK